MKNASTTLTKLQNTAMPNRSYIYHKSHIEIDSKLWGAILDLAGFRSGFQNHDVGNHFGKIMNKGAQKRDPKQHHILIEI